MKNLKNLISVTSTNKENTLYTSLKNYFNSDDQFKTKNAKRLYLGFGYYDDVKVLKNVKDIADVKNLYNVYDVVTLAVNESIDLDKLADDLTKYVLNIYNDYVGGYLSHIKNKIEYLEYFNENANANDLPVIDEKQFNTYKQIENFVIESVTNDILDMYKYDDFYIDNLDFESVKK